MTTLHSAKSAVATLPVTNLEGLSDHRGPMAFIDALVDVQPGCARCVATIRRDNPFLTNDRLPAWILVEYLAQSVAAFAGYLRAVEGKPRRHGLLIGCRNLRLTDAAPGVGDRLEMHVEEVVHLDDFGRFTGTARLEGRTVADGSLLVYESADWPRHETSLSNGGSNTEA